LEVDFYHLFLLFRIVNSESGVQETYKRVYKLYEIKVRWKCGD